VAYVSELENRPVVDIDGEHVGTLNDLLAAKVGEMLHPQVTAIVVKRRGSPIIISINDVAVLLTPVIPLNKRIKDVKPYLPAEPDLYLVRDVLDKQIIDTNGVRVVRVNDLELARVNENVYVSNVDIGGLGLLRRMGFRNLSRRLSSTAKPGKALSGNISWDDVELLAGDQPMRLKVPGEKLSDLHPADLAEIISDLNRNESSKFLETLDDRMVADTLEEVEPDFQASLVENMPDERVADLLEEMAPDEAADLLAELPKDRSQELLRLMETDDAADVRKLLTYPEDSAGGIMNTEFVSVSPDLTVVDTIKLLRETANEAETIYYIYVTDTENKLVGVFSLRQLVLSLPELKVSEFMQDRVITVNLLDTQDVVAQVISKYNLLAVPVVDDEEKMHGIVTADDALDKIIPTAWKKRLPRLYH
jgi:magnesium transporter